MIVLNRSKPKSLSAQIREAEQQILKHQRGVSIRTTKLVWKIHQQMTAPATLVLAGGIGFIVGEVTKGKSSKIGVDADQPDTAKTSPLSIALKLLVSAHTLYTALPLAWIIKSFQNPDASSQALQRQSRPLMASNKSDGRHRSK